MVSSTFTGEHHLAPSAMLLGKAGGSSQCQSWDDPQSTPSLTHTPRAQPTLSQQLQWISDGKRQLFNLATQGDMRCLIFFGCRDWKWQLRAPP